VAVIPALPALVEAILGIATVAVGGAVIATVRAVLERLRAESRPLIGQVVLEVDGKRTVVTGSRAEVEQSIHETLSEQSAPSD
jgi:predicted nucleic acid-binding protein